MASGHVNRAERGRTHGRTNPAALVKKVLANPEPSTHGPSRQFQRLTISVAIAAERTWLDPLRFHPVVNDPNPTLASSEVTLGELHQKATPPCGL